MPSIFGIYFRPLLFLFFTLIITARISQAENPPHLPIQENFTYDVQIFWVTKAAHGQLKIEHLTGNHYRAELVAETKGIASWLTDNRKNQYVSEMILDPKTRRFVSRSYTKQVFKGKNVERTTARIEAKKRAVHWKFFSNENLIAEGTDPIPEDLQYEDLLSAFFNFRNGGYGPLEPGRKMTVFTLPDYRAMARDEMERSKPERAQKFKIYIADRETESKYRKKYGRTKENGLLALVKVPNDLFGQTTGEIRVWFNLNLTPVAATVEDAIFFGDVHGRLIKSEIRR